LLNGPEGSTAVAGLIGHPVSHSLSPRLHNAAFQAAGLDWVYVAFPVLPGAGAEAVRAAGVLGLRGLSVTMPHKAAAAAAVDELSEVAQALGSVNTVTYQHLEQGWRARGDSTDGQGFVDSLADEGVTVAGAEAVVLGAGGAARAVTLALALNQAASVTVVARDVSRASAAAALAGGAGAALGASDEGLKKALARASLVVNATPVGMAAQPGLPFGLEAHWVPKDAFLAELIYHPRRSALLGSHLARGGRGCNGLGMLWHQAARQFESWTGRPAPLQAYQRAARSAQG